MISENKMRSLLIILAMLLSSTAFAFGPQSSNKNVLWDFDFVEEFDGLQDWAPNYSGCCNYIWDDANPERMPLLADGTRSSWVFYSGSTSPQKWIGGIADGKQVWRGTKAATIDMAGGSNALGPTRMGIYFGDARAPVVGDGYNSVRVFYMMYIPRNHFPTGCADGGSLATNCVAEYIEGQTQRLFGYYKLGDISINCGFDSSVYDPAGSAARCATNSSYGEAYLILNWRMQNPQYTPSGLLPMVVPQNAGEYAGDDAGSFTHLLGGWFGYEVYVRTQPGNATGLIDITIYDRDGNAANALVNQPFNIASGAQGKLWDYYVIGGNKSYTFGPTMDSAYYVDDFIVDAGEKGPIGPRYFAAIAQDNVPVSKPNAATNFSYTTRSRDAVVAGGATRGNLTQCPDGKWATVCKATVYDVRINCTNPSTRENGNSFLPAGIESLDWIFEPTGNGKTHSVKVPRCPFLVDLPPATYTVKQRTVLTHSGDGKVGNWSQISGSMEVPAP